MATIMSTENCYSCLNTEEDVYEVGGYSDFDSSKFDKDTLGFSQSAWDDEKEYFMSFLSSQIAEHEKRYRTDIVKIALAGQIGLWNRTPIGGRMISCNQNPLEFMGDVDNVEVIVTDDNTIQVLGHHHDGTHRMNLYLLSEGMLNKVNPSWNDSYFDFSPDDFEKIYEERKPLKLTKSGREYFNPTAD